MCTWMCRDFWGIDWKIPGHEMWANGVEYFCHSFQCDCSCCSCNFQHEIIELQNDDTLEGMYLTALLVEFYQRYINADDFSILRKHALKYVSLFGSTYCCEQFFSKLNLTKSRLGTRLTNENFEMELRVVTSSTSADIARLTKENFQPSH